MQQVKALSKFVPNVGSGQPQVQQEADFELIPFPESKAAPPAAKPPQSAGAPVNFSERIAALDEYVPFTEEYGAPASEGIGGFFGPLERGLTRNVFSYASNVVEFFGAHELGKSLLARGEAINAPEATGRYARPIRSLYDDPLGSLDDMLDVRRIWQELGENVPVMGAVALGGLLGAGAGFIAGGPPGAVAGAGAGARILYGLLEGGDIASDMANYEDETGEKINPILKRSLPIAVGVMNSTLGMSGIDSILKGLKIPGLRGKLIHTILAGGVEGATELGEEFVQATGQMTYREVPWPDVISRLQSSFYSGLAVGTGISVGLTPFGARKKGEPAPPPDESPAMALDVEQATVSAAPSDITQKMKEQEQLKKLEELAKPVNKTGDKAVAKVREASLVEKPVKTITFMTEQGLDLLGKAQAEFIKNPTIRGFFDSPEDLAESWAASDALVNEAMTQRAVNESRSVKKSQTSTEVESESTFLTAFRGITKSSLPIVDKYASATEGVGLYITDDVAFAEFFGAVHEVKYTKPKKILSVSGEPAYILFIDDTFNILQEPVKDTDSEWTKLHKLALQDIKGVYDPSNLSVALTKRMRDAGYDAVDFDNGYNTWRVLLDDKLVKSITPVKTKTPVKARPKKPERRSLAQITDEMDDRLSYLEEVHGDAVNFAAETDEIFQRLKKEASDIEEATLKQAISEKAKLDGKSEEQAAQDLVSARLNAATQTFEQQLQSLNDKITSFHTHVTQADINLIDLTSKEKESTSILEALNALESKAPSTLKSRIDETVQHFIASVNVLGEARRRLEAESARAALFEDQKKIERETTDEQHKWLTVFKVLGMSKDFLKNTYDYPAEFRKLFNSMNDGIVNAIKAGGDVVNNINLIIESSREAAPTVLKTERDVTEFNKVADYFVKLIQAKEQGKFQAIQKYMNEQGIIREERAVLTEAEQAPIVQRLKQLFPFLKFEGPVLPLIASRDEHVFGANINHGISWVADGARDDTVPHEAFHDLLLLLLAHGDGVAQRGLELARSQEQLVQWVGEEYAHRNAGDYVSSRQVRLRQWLREFWSRIKELFLSAQLNEQDVRNILGKAFYEGTLLERVGLNAQTLKHEALFEADESLANWLSPSYAQMKARYKSVPETLRTTVVNTTLKSFDAVDRMIQRGLPAVGEGFFNQLSKFGVNKEELDFVKFVAGREGWSGKKISGVEFKSVLMNYLVPIKISHAIGAPINMYADNDLLPPVYYPQLTVDSTTSTTYREYRFEVPFEVGKSHPRFTTPNMIGWVRTDVSPDGVFRIQEVQAADPIKALITEGILGNIEPSDFRDKFLRQLKPHINEFMIRAIIQRAAEDGHSKVRFAGPETIRRVEGHDDTSDNIKHYTKVVEEHRRMVNFIRSMPLNTFEKAIAKGDYTENGVSLHSELVESPTGVSLSIQLYTPEQIITSISDKHAGVLTEADFYNFQEQLISKAIRVSSYAQEQLKHYQQIAEKGLPIQQLYSALGAYLSRYKKGATRKVVDEYGNDWIEVAITPTDVDAIVQFQLDKKQALNELASLQDPSLKELDGEARALGIPVDVMRKAKYQSDRIKIMEGNEGFKLVEKLTGDKGIYDRLKPEQVSPFASYFGSSEYQLLRKGFTRAAGLVGKVIERSLLHSFQARQDVAGFNLFRSGKLKVAHPEKLRWAVQQVYNNNADKIPEFNLRNAAEGLVRYFKEIRNAYVESRLEILQYKTVAKGKPWLVVALKRLMEGAEPVNLVAELGIKNKKDIRTLTALYRRFNNVRHWGIDEFITNIEPGRFSVVDLTGSIIGVSETYEGAVKLARKFLERPGVQLTETKDENGNVKFVKSEFEELEVAISTDIRPPSPDQARLNKLKGRDNLLEVMDIYASRMRKVIALDPIYEQIKFEMAKNPNEFPESVAKIMHRTMRDAKGNYWLGDQILDSFLDRKLPKVSAVLNKEGRAYSRLVSGARLFTTNIKLGYRPIASAINFLGGTFQHTWAKVGSRYLVEAAQFVRSGEGRQLIKDEELYLGRGRIVEEMEYQYERVQLWKPLGLFQKAEKINVEVGFAANYLMARRDYKMDDVAAREHARRAVRFQQFVYNVASLPPVLRSPTGRIIGQFKTYLIKEIEFINSLRGKEIPRYLAATFAIGGLRGVTYAIKTVPLIWLFGGLLSQWDKWLNSMPKDAPQWARTMRAFVQRGVPGLFGGDVAAPAVIQLPQEPEELLGPFIGDVLAFFGDVVKPIFQGQGYALQDFAQLVRYKVPALNYYWQVTDTFIGDGKLYDSAGRPLYDASNWDRFLLATGVTPANKSREDAIARMLKDEEATRQARVFKAQNAFFAHVMKHRSVGDFVSWLSSDSFNDVMSDLVAAGALESLEQNAKFRFIPRETQQILKARVLNRAHVIESWPGQQ